jgi:hypothetical protein
VVHGDCSPGAPVVDEDEATIDDAPIERRAEDYAWRALAGGKSIPNPPQGTFREWAKAASIIDAREGIDAGVTIWSWANRAKALLEDKAFLQGIQALNALYLAHGGRSALRREFDQHVSLEAASETDRALLKCLHLDPERNAAARRH